MLMKVMSLFLKIIPLMQTWKINQFVVTWLNYELYRSLPEQISQVQTFLTTSSPSSGVLGQGCPDTITPRMDSWTYPPCSQSREYSPRPL